MDAARWCVWASVALAGALGGGGARSLDPAACAARFDVQRDKIIRTEESRELGARYLSELDVGARAECLRLCCETDACDVFVYEEKGPGSCYLFECGPPEDFRCKFTTHGNFSSGVLALSRRLAELQDREREPTPPAARSGSSAPPSPPAPRPSPPAVQPQSHPDLLLARAGVDAVGAGRCSRYQFQCRRGGECIAVYNACDGVPQCADGSDEAPELACPPPARAAPARLPTDPPPARWPPRLAQALPRRPVAPPPPPAYEPAEEAASSHIFSHKGGLMQEPESGPPAPYPPFEPPAQPPAPAQGPPPWARRAWPPAPHTHPQPHTHHQEAESGGGGGWGAEGAEGGGFAAQWGGAGGARRAWPVPPEPAPPRPDTLSQEVYLEPAGTLRDSAKKGPGAGEGVGAGVGPQRPAPPAPPPPRPAPHPQPPRVDIPKTKPHYEKMSEHVHPARGGDAGGAGAEARLADGLSEHPPAAVLLLVLGMVMTVGLAGMLACRAGAARRRLRRGKPFAHDADYLVNGMYL